MYSYNSNQHALYVMNIHIQFRKNHINLCPLVVALSFSIEILYAVLIIQMKVIYLNVTFSCSSQRGTFKSYAHHK